MRPLTLCLAYYENPGMLAEQVKLIGLLPPELKAMLRVIVVDDASPANPARLPEAPPCEMSLYRMRQDIPWNQDACRNLAVEQAETEWVLLTDMDHVPGVGLLRAAIAGPLDPHTAYVFARVSAPHFEPYKRHPNSWLMTRALYDRVGGYDERYAGVYGTDGMFATRLKAEANVVELPGFLIRYPRELIADASTTTLVRRSAENDALKDKVRAEVLASGKPRPVRGRFAWDRVA